MGLVPCVEGRSGTRRAATWQAPPPAGQFHRFRKIVVHPSAQTSFPVGRHRVGRDGDDRNARMDRCADTAGRFKAVHHRHLAVHQHQVVASVLDRFDGLGAIGDRGGLVSQLPQLRKNYVPVDGIILRHQDSRVSRDPSGRSRRSGAPIPPARGLLLDGRQLKNRREPEGGTLAFPAVDMDRAPHHLDELLRDSQPEPGAAVLACGGGVCLDEWRE